MAVAQITREALSGASGIFIWFDISVVSHLHVLRRDSYAAASTKTKTALSQEILNGLKVIAAIYKDPPRSLPPRANTPFQPRCEGDIIHATFSFQPAMDQRCAVPVSLIRFVLPSLSRPSPFRSIPFPFQSNTNKEYTHEIIRYRQ
jgi:hypothetical protein